MATKSQSAEKSLQQKGQQSEQVVSDRESTSATIGRAYFISWFALFIAIIGLVGIYFVWQQLQLNRVEFQQQVKQLASQTLAVKNQTEQLVSITNKYQTNYQHLQQEFAQTRTILNRLQQKLNNDQEVLVLAESEYLLRIAFYNISFAKEVDTSITLLETVNDRLASLADPTLLPIRQAIHDDIVQLKAMPKVNREDILLRLASLQTQVNALPFAMIGPNTLEKDKVPSQQHKAEEQRYPAWKRYFLKVSNAWKKIVIIRHNEQAVKPLTPGEYAVNQKNLYVILAQAQWAVIYGRADLYQANLEQALQLLKQYYQTDHSATQAMMKELQSLAKIQITTSYPDLSKTLLALQSVIQKREQNQDEVMSQ